MCMQDSRTLLIFIIQCDLSLEFSLCWNRRTKKVQYGLALRSVSFRTAKLNFIYSMAACPKTSNSKCSLFDWILRCLAQILQKIYNILMRRLLRLFETIAEFRGTPWFATSLQSEIDIMVPWHVCLSVKHFTTFLYLFVHRWKVGLRSVKGSVVFFLHLQTILEPCGIVAILNRTSFVRFC